MTHQQHILLTFGAYSRCSVRPMINALRVVGVAETQQGPSFLASVSHLVFNWQHPRCYSGQDELHHNP